MFMYVVLGYAFINETMDALATFIPVCRTCTTVGHSVLTVPSDKCLRSKSQRRVNLLANGAAAIPRSKLDRIILSAPRSPVHPGSSHSFFVCVVSTSFAVSF